MDTSANDLLASALAYNHRVQQREIERHNRLAHMTDSEIRTQTQLGKQRQRQRAERPRCCCDNRMLQRPCHGLKHSQPEMASRENVASNGRDEKQANTSKTLTLDKLLLQDARDEDDDEDEMDRVREWLLQTQDASVDKAEVEKQPAVPDYADWDDEQMRFDMTMRWLEYCVERLGRHTPVFDFDIYPEHPGDV